MWEIQLRYHSCGPYFTLLLKDGSRNWGEFARIERIGIYYIWGILCDHLGPLIEKMLKKKEQDKTEFKVHLCDTQSVSFSFVVNKDMSGNLCFFAPRYMGRSAPIARKVLGNV